MKIKAWGSVLLLSCLCSAVTAQNGNRYLEKPLPRGWGIRWFRILKRSLLPQEPLILPRHPQMITYSADKYYR